MSLFLGVCFEIVLWVCPVSFCLSWFCEFVLACVFASLFL